VKYAELIDNVTEHFHISFFQHTGMCTIMCIKWPYTLFLFIPEINSNKLKSLTKIVPGT